MINLKRLSKFTVEWLIGLTFIISAAIPQTAAAAGSITVGTTPPPAESPNVIVTTLIGSSLPDYIELYNQADTPINLTGWNAAVTIHDGAAGGCPDIAFSIPLPASWLLSKRYLTLERTANPSPGSLTQPFAVDATSLLASCLSPQLATLSLVDPSQTAEQLLKIPAAEWSSTSTLVAQHRQRNNSSSSTRTISSVFDTDYKFITGNVALNSDPLYAPPTDAAGLQILEILPNARTCAPTEIDATCSDYVKLYNPTTEPINLALYRLRIGYKGQSESVSNTFTWGQDLDPQNDELVLPPQQYFMLTSRNDGQPLSITDSGDYVWLDDAYGTTTYDPIVAYPDASSTTKVGQAWAYDGATWRWTSSPEPGAANYFPPVVVPPVTTTPTILKPCAPDQYRNPATNRCRSIVVATALIPCKAGQERNPDTNRCRSIVAASKTLAPCQPGWERNPATNRCRKAVSAVAGAATTSIKDVAAPAVDNTGWFVALLVIGLAGGYAVYEWRQDIRLLTQKIIAKGTGRLSRQQS